MPSALRLLALAALLAASLAPRPAAARPLRILTYNIHHGAGRDGRYDLDRIATVINSVNPDLVALQEVEQGTTRYPQRDMQLDELAELTDMTGYFGKTLNRLGGEYGNGVLINPEFRVLRTLNHTMPNPADGELRKVMEVQLQFNDEGTTRRVDFFATHMDHTSGTNRQAQVDFINDLVTNSTTPAILAGDFNFDDAGPAYAKLITEWTDPTAADPGRSHQIDYVVHRAADQWTVASEGRFIVNTTTANASDHYPLLAVLELVPYSADFNRDGDVDGADLLTWQRNLAAAGPAAIGDANHDHAVNTADRTVWSQQFAKPAALNSLQSAAHSLQPNPIPEPTAAALILPAAIIHLTHSRKRKRQDLPAQA